MDACTVRDGEILNNLVYGDLRTPCRYNKCDCAYISSYRTTSHGMECPHSALNYVTWLQSPDARNIMPRCRVQSHIEPRQHTSYTSVTDHIRPRDIAARPSSQPHFCVWTENKSQHTQSSDRTTTVSIPIQIKSLPRCAQFAINFLKPQYRATSRLDTIQARVLASFYEAISHASTTDSSQTVKDIPATIHR